MYRGALKGKNTSDKASSTRPGKKTVSSGGYEVYGVADFEMLERVIMIGAAGTYYAGREDHTQETLRFLHDILSREQSSSLKMAVDISKAGRAPKNDHAILVAAVATTVRDNSPEWTEEVANAVREICRTGSHILTYSAYVKELRSFGRRPRIAIANWYHSFPAEDLAYQVVKYQNRGKWGHRDVLRLAHPALNGDYEPIAKWVLRKEVSERSPEIIRVYDEMTRATSEEEVVNLVTNYKLTWEFVPSQWLGSRKVWEVLLPNLPITAMMRNVNKLTSSGVLESQENRAIVTGAFRDINRIKGGRVHPLQVLIAAKTYGAGRGFKGNLSWNPIREIEAAFDDMFYASFGAMPSGKRRMAIGVDVSGSMTTTIPNTNVTYAEAASVIAMASIRSNGVKNTFVWGFTRDLVDLDIQATDSLAVVSKKVQKSDFGTTNPAAVFSHLADRKIEVDAAMSITDNEITSGYGNKTYQSELDRYRRTVNSKAKSIVAAMESNRITINDPTDVQSLDICGFDSAMLQIVDAFLG